MPSTYGENLHLSIFGTSHGPHIGMTLEGIPAGQTVNMDALQAFMARRAPGQGCWSTSRKEADIPQFRSGLSYGKTNGETIAAYIENQNANSADYRKHHHIPRPGHADYTAWMKYGMDYDMAGGGPFSGRLTAPLCIAGGMCKQWLEAMGMEINAQVTQVGTVRQEECKDFSSAMLAAIAEAKSKGDSLGGRIHCTVTGVPVGLGGPLFDGVEGKLATILYSIPAVKAVGFGAGEAFAYLTGSQANDAFVLKDGKIQTATNSCGGILGGITNGMPLEFDVTFKPTPSIAIPQASVDLERMEEVTLQIQGRHDPCILPRAVPVVEAAAAIALYDLILGRQKEGAKNGSE